MMSLSKIFFSILLIWAILMHTDFSEQAFAGDPTEGCFFKHVTDAAALDQVRKPLYSALTQGKSEEVSDLLITFADLSIAPATGIDLWAAFYQLGGISVICDDLIPMTNTPPFIARSSGTPEPISEFQDLNAQELARAIRGANQSGGFAAVALVCQQRLAELESTPSYHCMVRHILSSILRAANLAPKQEAAAKAAGYFTSTEGISWAFIELQLLGLDNVNAMDELAAPIQATGVPILCQDVPPIPAV